MSQNLRHCSYCNQLKNETTCRECTQCKSVQCMNCSFLKQKTEFSNKWFCFCINCKQEVNPIKNDSHNSIDSCDSHDNYDSHDSNKNAVSPVSPVSPISPISPISPTRLTYFQPNLLHKQFYPTIHYPSSFPLSDPLRNIISVPTDIGLPNYGNSCFVNVVFQIFLHAPEIWKACTNFFGTEDLLKITRKQYNT